FCEVDIIRNAFKIIPATFCSNLLLSNYGRFCASQHFVWSINNFAPIQILWITTLSSLISFVTSGLYRFLMCRSLKQLQTVFCLGRTVVISLAVKRFSPSSRHRLPEVPHPM